MRFFLKSLKIFKSRDNIFDFFLCAFLPFLISLLFIFENFHNPESFLTDSAELYVSLNEGTDMAAYIQQGLGILRGKIERPFYRAPLYSFLLTFIFLFSRSILAVAVAQSLLFAATIFFIYLTAKIFFGRSGGLFSAVIAILSGFFQFWVIIPHSTITEAFLAVLSVYCLSCLLCEFRKSNAIVAGMSCGLLCLVRPNFLAVCPLVITGLFLMRHKIFGKAFLTQTLLLGLISVISFIITLLPVIIWNNIGSDSFVLLSTNGSETWRIANSKDSLAENFIYPKGELMNVFSREFVIHQINKAIAFCKNREVPQNVSFYVYRHFSLLLNFQFVSFGFILGLFIASWVYFLNSLKKFWHIYVFSILYIITVILFFVIGRFRITILPVMIVPCGGFLCNLIVDLKLKKNLKTGIFSFAIFAIMFLFSEPWKDADFPIYWRNTAGVAFAKGDLSRFRYCMGIFIEKQKNRSANVNNNVLLEYAGASALLNDFAEAERVLNELRGKTEDDFIAESMNEISILKEGKIDLLIKKALEANKGGIISELLRRRMALELLLKEK